MSHCLRFLCYHHQSLIFNTQQALHDLFITVKENISDWIYFVLGVCFEISGDEYTGYQCYYKALQCEDDISTTAEKRKAKLDGNICGI